MNILILCKKFPFPLKEGEPIAISYLARSLCDLGCNISLLVLNTSKHFFDPANLPESANFYKKIYTVKINNDITVKGALASFINGESYILSRFKSDDFEKQLATVLTIEHYDVVQLETIYMAHYIPVIRKFSTAVIALRTHNVEHLIWKRVAATTKSFWKKYYLKYQNRSLKKFELNQVDQCDLLVTITDKDQQIFRELNISKTAVVAPVGINIEDYEANNPFCELGQSIAFIGALDWIPNQDGITWFLEKVWPEIEQEFPEATLHIAGKNTPDWMFKKETRRIIVAGEVADAKDFIRSHPVFVAPLFSGSGIKIKVLEGMALSRAVITTSIGAEGIPAKDGEEIFIANDEKQYLKAIRTCFQSPGKCREMGDRAKAFIRRNFDDKTIGKTVLKAYQRLVDRS